MSDKMEARVEVQRRGPESLVKEVQDETLVPDTRKNK